MVTRKACNEVTPVNAKGIIEKNIEEHMRENVQGDDNVHWLAVDLYGEIKGVVPPAINAKPDPKNWFPNTGEIIFAKQDQFEDFVDLDDFKKRGFKDEDEMADFYLKGSGSIRNDFPDIFNEKAEKAVTSWGKLYDHFCAKKDQLEPKTNSLSDV